MQLNKAVAQQHSEKNSFCSSIIAMFVPGQRNEEEDVISNTDCSEISINSNHLRLYKALAQPDISYSTPETYTLTTDAPPIARRPSTNVLLGPVAPLSLQAAVSTWLESRSCTLSDLPKGIALLYALNIPPPHPPFRRRLRLITRTARALGIPSSLIPLASDLRLGRNWPKLICAVAAIASLMDPTAWHTIHPGPSPHDWRDATVSEAWQGDATARSIAAIFQRHCCLLICGSQGSGKSATLSTLFGRPIMPASHALAVRTPHHAEARKLRHLRAVCPEGYPVQRNIPTGSEHVDIAHVKVDDVVITIVELPAMETSAEGLEYGCVIQSTTGDFMQVVRGVQTVMPDVVLLTERIDDFDERRFRASVRRVVRIFGRNALQRAVVVLSHGGDKPPCGMRYEVWMFDQKRRVRNVLREMVGTQGRIPGVVVFENSKACERAPGGERVLADGSDFVSMFLDEVGVIAHSPQADVNVKARGEKRWWNRPLLFLAVTTVLANIR